MSAMKRHELIVGGTGGQGVITIGYALAEAAAMVHRHVTRFPTYMATMRGGPAYCTVIFSDDEIPAPILSRTMNAIAMEGGAYSRLKKEVRPGGHLFVNSSIVKKVDPLEGYAVHQVPVTDLAQEIGGAGMANLVMLGAYRQITGVLSDELIVNSLAKTLAAEGKDGKLDRMIAAYQKGVEFARGMAT
jgi:2-oxoglutarate ferredoxin oxidoreductase subunit gamma